MLPLDVIRKYYSDLIDEELKKIQVFVFQLCCGVMQYFYGNDRAKLDSYQAQLGDWEEDSEYLDFKSKEG